ncbi:excinuclease ABC subunit UvrC [Chitinivibrio alkaliphilus]|uniref:UvrABC system protein C n=1 Tax=Chitinivibrio alkaliphilus ACht1 TaxID=1313304 RepID=U7D7S7_9BACT|nr:excinuclease ABC subunit UvrC [Chitinivibrio alkaliphilus]ERP31147.1 excinuclease ABC, C subunit [Chitinivibrio alkaliphilus ACht1]
MIDYESCKPDLPRLPGAYLFTQGETILYIGKANSIAQRVASYFSGRQERRHIPVMLRRADSIRWIVTENETEALVLEANLVKKHCPPYNIELKDDKHFPYIKITTYEPFPRICIVRSVTKDGAVYFGPFTEVTKLRRIVSLLRKSLRIRTCRRTISYHDNQRPCLNYSMGICSGPCNSHISHEEYAKSIDLVQSFFSGRRREVIARLTSQMKECSERRDYEKAALLRDRLQDIRSLTLRQGVDLKNPSLHCDVFASYVGATHSALTVMMIREGVIINQNNHIYGRDRWDGADLAMIVLDYYQRSMSRIPDEVLLAPEFEQDLHALSQWVETYQGGVTVKLPRRGEKYRLVQRCAKAARLYLSQKYLNEYPAIHEELAHVCQLPRTPKRIEAFDISNLGSSFAVAGMVHFFNGEPDKQYYRRYKIKSISGQNDFAMMMEVVHRRMARLAKAPADEVRPDLFLIDGGKGQLHSAMEALRDVPDPPMIISLAKKEEIIHSPYADKPIALSDGHPVRRLVERIRDEVHRFAITYHRKLRGRNVGRSLLEEVRGIGPQKARLLLRQYQSVQRIAACSPEELAQQPGITEANARDILQELREFL